MFTFHFDNAGLQGIDLPSARTAEDAKADMDFIRRIAPLLRILDKGIKRIEHEYQLANDPAYAEEQQREAESIAFVWIDFQRVHPEIAGDQANWSLLDAALKEKNLKWTASNLEMVLLSEATNLAPWPVVEN